MKNAEVTYAVLHAAIFVPNGGGPIGPTLTTVKNPTTKLIDRMQVSEDGLFLLVTMGKFKVVVPMTNVTHVILKEVSTTALKSVPPTLPTGNQTPA